MCAGTGYLGVSAFCRKRVCCTEPLRGIRFTSLLRRFGAAQRHYRATNGAGRILT